MPWRNCRNFGHINCKKLESGKLEVFRRITLFCLHYFLVFIEIFSSSLQLFPFRRPNFRLSWRNYPAWRCQQCGQPQPSLCWLVNHTPRDINGGRRVECWEYNGKYSDPCNTGLVVGALHMVIYWLPCVPLQELFPTQCSRSTRTLYMVCTVLCAFPPLLQSPQPRSPPFGLHHKWFDQISNQWESQENRFALIHFGKIQFLPPCIWDLPFMSYHLCSIRVHRLWSHHSF